ncbi:hypothetical protein JEZ13_09530 [bacterium]|nr:hypothetical protein [bacterium]
MIIKDNLPIKISKGLVTDIKVSNDSPAFVKMMELAQEYQTKYSELAISEIPGVQEARTFFRAIGLDPTKRRPSSEALLRRALNGKDLYRINNIVDAGNYSSLKFLLPICLYDYDTIQGDIIVKIGDSKDRYLAHNNREMVFTDKFVLCDDLGAFGSPLTDSLRTAVTPETTKVLIIMFAPESYDSALLDEHIRYLEDTIKQFNKSTIQQISSIP